MFPFTNSRTRVQLDNKTGGKEKDSDLLLTFFDALLREDVFFISAIIFNATLLHPLCFSHFFIQGGLLKV